MKTAWFGTKRLHQDSLWWEACRANINLYMAKQVLVSNHHKGFVLGEELKCWGAWDTILPAQSQEHHTINHLVLTLSRYYWLFLFYIIHHSICGPETKFHVKKSEFVRINADFLNINMLLGFFVCFFPLQNLKFQIIRFWLVASNVYQYV